MFRSITPLRRTYSIFALATFGVAAIFGMSPALAQETPPVVIPAEVTGRDGLSVTATGVPGTVTVTLTDASKAGAVWTFEDPGPATDSRVLSVDLAAPGLGVEPVNGVAAVAVTVDGTDLHHGEVVLDRDPAAPAIEAEVVGQDVELSWNAASGPGAVTYSLERADGGGSWVPLRDAAAPTSFSDLALTAGSYTYRLTAAVPGADGEPNRSQATEVSVTVEELAPVPPDEPDTGVSEDPPVGPRPDAGDPADGGTRAPQSSGAQAPREVERRSVAAAGGSIKGIAMRSPGRPVVHRYARGPNLAGLATRSAVLHRLPMPVVSSAMLREIAEPWAPDRPRITAPPPPTRVATLTVATVEPGSGTLAVAVVVLMMLVGAHAAVWRSRVSPAAADRL